MTDTRKVVLFYDVPDWAFHNVARNVAALSEGWSVSLCGRADWFGRPDVVARIAEEADVLVFLWRFDLLAFLDCLGDRAWKRFLGSDRPALVTMVYDHLYHAPPELESMGDPFAVSDAVGCCSDRLRRLYDRAPHLPSILATLPDGVDLRRFVPSGDTAPAHRAMRIGWVGNGAWGGTVATDLKGRHGIFEPAMRLLKEAGRSIDIRVADAAVQRIPREQMPQFYRDLDVLVCTSAMEGTPNPVLEAMASGCAVVSTDVGIVPEVLGPLQSDFILGERSPEALAAALTRLLDDPALCQALKAENLDRRAQLSWESRAPLWDGLFRGAIAAREAAAGRACSQALAGYRKRTRSGISRARRLVASSPAAFRIYETMRTRFPKLVRQTKKLLS